MAVRRGSRRDAGTIALFDVATTAAAPALVVPPDADGDPQPTLPIPQLVSAGNVTDDAVAALAAAAIAANEEKRSTWSRWNLTAETLRAIRDWGWQFSTPKDLLSVRDRVVTRAIGTSVSLDPPDLADVPAAWRDPTTGRSAFAGPETFTSRAVLDAETRLLRAADDRSGPTAPPTYRDVSGRSEQVAAVEAISTSGRTLDLLIGPAGTGKTAAIDELARRWRTEHGGRSVVMLAVSATAADVLSDATGSWADTAASGCTTTNGKTRTSPGWPNCNGRDGSPNSALTTSPRPWTTTTTHSWTASNAPSSAREV